MLSSTPSTISRIGLWLGCCLLAVAGFGSVLGPRGSLDVALRIALVFVLPVCLLYLPFIVKIKDAEQKRIRVILISGLLIGPTVLLLLDLVLILRGESAYDVWHGDPDALGEAVQMAFAPILGLAMTSLYALLLKAHHRWSATALACSPSPLTEETNSYETDMARPFCISHRGGRGQDSDRSVSVRQPVLGQRVKRLPAGKNSTQRGER